MTAQSQLESLKRPKILVRAAKIGLKTYRRTQDLSRFLGYKTLPQEGQALDQITALEADMERCRKDGDASYSIKRHIALLTALIDELRWSKALG